ncbi:hypothetical protein UK23_23015 [Lentzea aerocolonigenes]|uniref:Uncharacterized protein n=1 Tax=Lentzea aerocolonigenes TaxID=68170 RepID=A0A0F0GYY3_LENAE|nr:hypothetical protein [Lentzea aerocolonigenes]KJK46638.1 hypothetical protein UK23_23015 [Lentzea aerocolonigenes]
MRSPSPGILARGPGAGQRGLALATLRTAIIDAGHSVEVWSGFAGEPPDLGRLIFAVAHPVMLRQLWFGVRDAQPN